MGNISQLSGSSEAIWTVAAHLDTVSLCCDVWMADVNGQSEISSLCLEISLPDIQLLHMRAFSVLGGAKSLAHRSLIAFHY